RARRHPDLPGRGPPGRGAHRHHRQAQAADGPQRPALPGADARRLRLPASSRTTPAHRFRALLLPPLAGGRPGWGPPGPRCGIPVPVLRCPHPTLPRTRGREPKKPRRALLPLPTLAGEGAKAVAPQAPRLLPPLAGEGRDGGHLALAVASPFPCSDAPPQPSPARGEGAGGWRVDGGRVRVSGHASGYATWIWAIEAGAVPGRRRARP